jgi:helix-turn-helix protein
MKKLITFISIVAIIIVTNNKIYAQEFLGIKVGGNLNEVVAKFKLKGFKVTSPDNLSPLLVGKAGITQVELVISSTPITKTVYQFSVYLPKRNDWDEIKAEYQDYLKTLTDKYGSPNDTFNFFISPYKEGEGDEMNAITMEKCRYVALWENIILEISKYKQVEIDYQNKNNFEVRDREIAKLKKDAF